MSMIQLAALLPLLGACVAQDAGSSSSRSSASNQNHKPTVGEVFAHVHPSVVTIGTVGYGGPRDGTGKVATSAGIGSGVLVSGEGRILTAAHVVQTADELAVGFADGTVQSARVISSDPSIDIALIMLDEAPPSSALVAPIGNSDRMDVGQSVFVVGAPQGLTHTLTVGHISARRVASSPLHPNVEIDTLQTDAAINQGNSGGPMFNMDGEVVGIVSYIVSKGGGSEGLGFAISSNVCKELLLDRRPMWTGMEYILLSGELASLFNLPEGRSGLLIQHVAKDSPGEKLGLRGGSTTVKIADVEFLLGGDVIMEVFGIGLDEENALPRIRAMFEELPNDGFVELQYLRDGKTNKVRRRRDRVGI